MPEPQKAKYEFESHETNPEAPDNKACVLVTMADGRQFDVQIKPSSDGLLVEIIDYLGLNTLAHCEAYNDDIGALGNDG